ncbi:MAG: DNA methyltransferase, partial [Candidatus Hadarchaeum sp.]
PETPAAAAWADSTAIKTQLRILTLDPPHLYHTDRWVLDQICLSPSDQTADAIWQKHLQAFDVERVTRQFYEDYTAILEKLKTELEQQGEDLHAHKEDIHAFAQQLLNRLLFLYFVQKKDWLRWNGGPDRHYLRTLWRRYCALPPSSRTGFYIWLKALFFDAFNNQRAAIATNRALPEDVRTSFLSMPFLNGGLFERNEWDELNVKVPDDFFTALFDRFRNEEPGFLERYNFTVDESTALEVEVAVDPEMLGKVYESQVQREERHGAGIFYTPREEIDYMCRLSLIEYLHEQTRLPKDDLIPLVMEPRRLLDAPADGIIPLASMSETKQREALRAIETALRQVRVVDPAVGSGSFLVGMMKALAELQQAIAERLERKRVNEFDLKRRIILENLYGVDVKEWAVRVCELRLWLALTIEAQEEQIGLYTQPVLPKLSFRVRTGDSLVEEVAETPLVLRGTGRIPARLQKRLRELAQDKADLFAARSRKKPRVIEQEEQKLLVDLLNEKITHLDARIQELRVEQPGLTGMGDERTRRKQSDPHRQCLQDLTAKLEALTKARAELATGKTPPFFVWDVGFGEVFAEKGGFDIVIGNPPYVRQEEIAPPTLNPDNYNAEEWRALKRDYKNQLARGVAALWGNTARIDRKSDLYVYFYYAGLSLLRPGGVFCFINSNSWLDVDYGAELQEFLLRHMRIGQIIDNHAKRSFAESDVNTVIVLLQRPVNGQTDWNHVAKFIAYKKPFEEVLTVPNLLAVEHAGDVIHNEDMRVYPITQRDLWLDGAELPEETDQAALELTSLEALKYGGGKWGGKYLRAPDIFFTILEKGKGKLVRLGDIAEVRRGFTTGANEFFYLEPTGQAAPEGLVHVRNGAGWEGYLETEFLKPVIKSPREVRRIIVRPEDLRYRVFMCHKSKEQLKHDGQMHALAYIEWGERQWYNKRPTCQGRINWWHVGPRTAPKGIIPCSYRGLFIVYKNSNVLVDKRLYELHCTDGEILLSSLNSSLYPLFLEMQSRSYGGGGGPIDATVYEISNIYVLAPKPLNEAHRQGILMYFDVMSQRAIRSIFEELGLRKPNRDYSNIDPKDVSLDKVLPDRRALDQVVFEALGLTEEEQLEVYRAVVELVKMRLSKARSV